MQNPECREFYTHNNPESQQIYVGMRRAKDWVGFFLPHLKQDMRVLDCGCGVGSITLDLAELVAPGEVIGIDMDEKQLQVARRNAEQRALTNASFEEGNIYQLRFDSNSFDAALAHTLLYHLSDPLRAMQELRRVLKPGGIVAISDDDLSTIRFSPNDPMVPKVVDLITKIVLFNGGSPFYSPHLRSLLLQAGFVRTEGFAVAAEYYGRLEETQRAAFVMNRILDDSVVSNLVIEQGWTTQEELNEMMAWIHDWGERPDAFMAIMYCAALGWNE